MVTGKLIAYEGGVGDVTLIRPDGTGRRALHGEALSPRKYAFDRLGTLLPSVTLLMSNHTASFSACSPSAVRCSALAAVSHSQHPHAGARRWAPARSSDAQSRSAT